MLTFKSYRNAAFYSAAALATGFSTMAMAAATEAVSDAAPTDEGMITVTGQRQPYLGTTPLKELPQIVQTLSAASLQEAGITKLQTALDFVAGVARQNNFGGLFDSYAIRGFTGDESTSSSYLLNGFNASRGYGGARDASNIERIEVIKGPTSALFGRGDPGGAVNIITKKPYLTGSGGDLQLSAGSFDSRRVQGDVNVAVSDRLAVRITGAYDEGDSYRDYIHHKTFTVTPSILWQFDELTSLSYDFEYVHQEIPFDRGIVALNGALDVVPRSRFLGEPGDGPITTEAFTHQAQLQHSFDDNWTMLIGASYRTSSFNGFSSEAENTASRQSFYTNGTTLSRQRRFRDYDTRDTTVRGEISGTVDTFGLTHHLQIGADWNDFVIDTIQNRFRPPAVASQTTLARGNAVNIFNPVYGNLAVTSPFINSNEDDESAGVYVQDMIDVADWLKLRAGGRYDIFNQIIINRLSTIGAAHQNKRSFSPQVGVSVLPSRSVTLYASFGRGFRPNIGNNFANQAFAPERTRAYEVGSKFSAFNNALNASLALYTMTKNNVLTADPNNAGFSLAIGKARSKGIEASINGKLPYRFRLDLSYAYTDAEVARDAIDANFGFALLKGDPLINIPKHGASALVFKDFDLLGREASIGFGVNYVGKRLAETGYRNAAGNFFMLPHYTLTRVLASFSPTDRIKISGEVTNLFDVHYFPSSYSRVWVMPGAPRQFSVRLGYAF